MLIRQIVFLLAITCFDFFGTGIGENNVSDIVLEKQKQEKDEAGLYNQDILDLYNSTNNVSRLFLKENYQTYYFSNLADNVGDNTKGSCGFVATGMMLSFWDTYWNDEIIPEHYEKKSEIASDHIRLDEISPGIIQEPKNLANASQEEYKSNISKYSDAYFQFKLMDIYQNHISSFDYDATKRTYNYGLGYTDYYQLFSFYLKDYLSLPSNDYVIRQSTSNVKNDVIALVKKGIPVRVSIRDEQQVKGNHCVVAYDYDETTDSLFCNFGWGSNATHVTIEQMGYEIYGSYTAIELLSSHSHSYNYCRTDESGIETRKCVCSTVIPSTVKIAGDSNLDILPTFQWDSLIHEKWFKNIGLSHYLSILDSNKREIFKKANISDNKYTLGKGEFDQVLNLSANNYYVYVGLASDADPYWDDYYCCVVFRKPNTYANKSSFLPGKWGFVGRYYFSNELDDAHLETEPERKNTIVTSNGLTITTDRLRCGYIENSYVVLSPRRENAGRAYFEMNFDKPVYSFMYRSCLWSSSENLDGIAIVQSKDIRGDWTTLGDIPISSLKAKEKGLTQFVEQTPSGIFCLRFETTATATGTRNKGRLCLDDIVFSLKSGSSNNTYVSGNYSTK